MWKGSNYGGELELGGIRDILRVAHALVERGGPTDAKDSANAIKDTPPSSDSPEIASPGGSERGH